MKYYNPYSRLDKARKKTRSNPATCSTREKRRKLLRWYRRLGMSKAQALYAIQGGLVK